jgi:hypothetical protein
MTMMESDISLVRKSVEENRVSEKNEGENEEETHEGRRRSRTLCVGDISTSSRRGGIRKRTAESSSSIFLTYSSSPLGAASASAPSTGEAGRVGVAEAEEDEPA